VAGLAATAALSACGFNYPTDRINNITAGVNYRNGNVDVLNAVVVAKAPNSGTFVATVVNGSSTKSVTLQSATGDNTTISSANAKPFTLQPGSVLNLADQPGGIPVFGTFQLGQFVTLSLAFDNGETANLNVPVVADDGQWAGLDIATASPSPSAGDSPSSPPSDGSSDSTDSPSDTASPSS
jgi:hypothetical protein